RNRRGEIAQQRVVQGLLPGERTFLRGQGLVFECLQLRSDVALGVLERLPAPVVVRYALDMRVCDFDVEAVHAVVLDLEVRDAGAGALACFELYQERTAVLLDRAQFVQLSVVSARDDVALAQNGGRLGRDGASEQRRPLRIDGERIHRVREQRTR